MSKKSDGKWSYSTPDDYDEPVLTKLPASPGPWMIDSDDDIATEWGPGWLVGMPRTGDAWLPITVQFSDGRVETAWQQFGWDTNRRPIDRGIRDKGGDPLLVMPRANEPGDDDPAPTMDVPVMEANRVVFQFAVEMYDLLWNAVVNGDTVSGFRKDAIDILSRMQVAYRDQIRRATKGEEQA